MRSTSFPKLPWLQHFESLQDKWLDRLTRIPYFPGCTLKTKARNFEKSALASTGLLGIELTELPRWNCCGAVYPLTSDDLMQCVASVGNLIRVQEMNQTGMVSNEYRLVVLCSMCLNVLKRSHKRMIEQNEQLKKINEFMCLEKEPYKGNVTVVHLLELLKEHGFEKIRDAVKKPLSGLRVSPYYGCALLRPRDVGIDDPEKPKIQEDLLSTLGATVVDNPLKLRCCGSYQTVRDKQLVINLAYDILSRAQDAGAEAISTSCPLCSFNIDNRQKEIMENHSEFKPLPVFYFTQLMAVAFGLGQEHCGFEQNHIDPQQLLKDKGVL
jgi:heterodisulfide reductase subunit B